jgi:NitT/TauT family transport system permease protein
MSPMSSGMKSLGRRLPAVGVFALLSGLWWGASSLDLFPPSLFPSPQSVVWGFREEIASGRLFTDMVASLYRVTAGFVMAALLGIPLGLVLGRWRSFREAFLPCINFFRNLSPLAWIPFAILWFGIGDSPAVFLIFMAAFFPMVLSTLAAVASIPALHFRVARDFEFSALEVLTKVTLPAIAPQVITTLRLTAGLSWLVVVAAEMIVGRDGLGFAVWDARNGLRTDLLVVAMVAIGSVGILLDWGLRQLSNIPSVRWGYEQ